MFITRETITMTTAADGSGTAYTSNPVNGRIISVQYVKGTFDDGSTMTLTAETTGLAIWAETAVNASAIRAPRQATHNTSGVASLYAAAGQAVNDHIAVANERLKMVVANGGNAKTATWHIIVG